MLGGPVQVGEDRDGDVGGGRERLRLGAGEGGAELGDVVPGGGGVAGDPVVAQATSGARPVERCCGVDLGGAGEAGQERGVGGSHDELAAGRGGEVYRPGLGGRDALNAGQQVVGLERE